MNLQKLAIRRMPLEYSLKNAKRIYFKRITLFLIAVAISAIFFLAPLLFIGYLSRFFQYVAISFALTIEILFIVTAIFFWRMANDYQSEKLSDEEYNEKLLELEAAEAELEVAHAELKADLRKLKESNKKWLEKRIYDQITKKQRWSLFEKFLTLFR